MTLRPRPSSPACLRWGALLLAGACNLAQAQWQWRDATGQMQYSDLPPPRGTPARDIIQRPLVVARQVQPEAAPSASAASVPGSIDPALEQRRKDAERQEAERRKLEQQRIAERRAQQQAQNCEQARSQLRLLESGERVVRSGPGGERYFLSDTDRAGEVATVRQVIATECR